MEPHPHRSSAGAASPASRPLEELLGEPFATRRFLELAIPIASALADVHAQGVIHKDVKPQNILVDEPARRVWLTGFAVASRIPGARQVPKNPALIEGTLPYMAPEQTGRMNRGVDRRADLYALGITFYRMLTGRHPFTAHDPLEWVHCHLARLPVPASEVLPSVPPMLSSIVTKLLEKAAEDRYQSAAGLRLDLERCLDAWVARGSVDPFPLAQIDVSDRFSIPEKLYGRESQTTALLQGFARMAESGRAALVVVSGEPGCGKSSLVSQIWGPTLRQRGLLAAAKFDQYQQDVPYSTLIGAFRSVVLELLTEPEDRLAAWRRALADALGPLAQVVAELVPELTLVVGHQAPPPALPVAEAQNRFFVAFQAFVDVFARREHPVALFLDDLQWADAASLRLLRSLVQNGEGRWLYVVAGLRDVEPAHPARKMIDELRSGGAPVQDIGLGPLAPDDLERLVADTVSCRGDQARPLAQLVAAKTASNPFFVVQFLGMLHDEHLLEFDPTDRRWHWDLDRIRAKTFTDNVVDLVIAKLRRLPGETQKALEVMACAGSAVALELLALVLERPPADTSAVLWPAVLDGVLLSGDGAYRFAHDRIQQAAYLLTPEIERPGLHLRIGRAMRARAAGGVEAIALDVASQLDRALDLVTDPGERAELFTINVLAGRKARVAVAFAAAVEYLRVAASLLPADAWSDRYEDTFNLWLERCECEFVGGSKEEAERLIGDLVARARSELDRVRASRLRLQVYALDSRHEDVLAAGLEALKALGMPVPARAEDLGPATAALAARVAELLQGRPLSDLLGAPEASDPRVRAALGILSEMISSVSLEIVRLSLTHGCTEDSPFGIHAYASVLVGAHDDLAGGFELGAAAVKLSERLGGVRWLGGVLLANGHFMNFWRRPFATDVPILERARRASLESGDLASVGYGAIYDPWHAVEMGRPLEEVLEVARASDALLRRLGNRRLGGFIGFDVQFVRCLQGKTNGPSTLEGDGFDVTEQLRATAYPQVPVWHDVRRLVVAFIHGDLAVAQSSARAAQATVGALMSMPISVTYVFFHALTLAALHDRASPTERQEYAAEIGRSLQKLRLWADSCPENFRSRHALVAAEVARIESRDNAAMQLYEQAIRSAADNGLVHNEALAYELASRFYRSRGFVVFADTYLGLARAAYARWGATAKVQMLDELYPTLSRGGSRNVLSTIATPVEQLDLLSVVEASQRISGESGVEGLSETLLRLVLAESGARRGVLLLAEGDELRPRTEATLDASGHVVIEPVPGESRTPVQLPASILNYVRRALHPVILDDARAAGGGFAGDPYLDARRPRSVLCLPLVKGAALVGALYLENEITPAAFTPRQLSTVQLLATQAAISLESARAFEAVSVANQRFRSILSAATAYAIIVVDPQGIIRVVNEGAERMLGYHAGELVDHADLTSLHDRFELAAAAKAAGLLPGSEVLLAAARQGRTETREWTYLRKDGSRLTVSLAVTAMRGDDGAISGFVGIARDVTDEKKLEQQLLQAQKMESVGLLAGGIAHDFNNLLVPILGYVDLLQRLSASGSTDQAHLAQIRRAAERARDLTQRLLAFSRKQIIELRTVDFGALLVRLEGMLRRMIREDIRIQVQVPSRPILVRADAGQIEQVLVNLAVNAQDAMPHGGLLLIELSETELDQAYTATHPEVKPGRYVMLAVTDTGHGMDEATARRAFEPFFTTKEPGHGTGLGLSTVYGIVKQHGGTVTLYSEPGRGTTFKVFVPRGSDPAVEAEPSAADRVVHGHETILVVEDEEMVRTIAEAMLGSLGYRTLVTDGAAQALAVSQAHEGRIHLMLTDVVMPMMNGRQLHARLLETRPDLKVLFMSGYTPNVIAHQGVLEEGVHFVQKPFTLATLSAGVRAALDDG